MVLFYCTFVSLKAHSPLTVNIDPEELKIGKETRLFQAYGYLPTSLLHERLNFITGTKCG